ncbi:sodium:solute symporter family protein [Halosimplex salinum]|uniref:sodium:solute symporter family protein n=1 Tax=Halosimplex salinum TaxID=1710538 RepID=UPI000F47C123|nr:sodium:solute symporter family protein [Halosimplex salinum]
MVSLQATVALTTIGVYLLVVLAVGYRGWQIGTLEVDDWMAAGRDLGLVVLLFTYTATYHSAFAFLGIGGFVYDNGIGIFGAAFLWVALSGLILWVLGTRVWLLGKKYGYITPADLVGDLYDSDLLARLVSLTLVVVTFPYVAIQLIGSGLVFETATRGLVSFEVGAALLLLVGVLYVWLGGLRAVAWTDTIQGVFLFAAMWLAGWVFVFTAFRGPASFWTRLSENFAAYLALPGPAGLFTPAYYTTLWLTFALGIMMLPHLFLRYVAARSPRVLRWTAAFGTGYLILFYVPTAFLALGAVVAFPDLARPDSAIPAVLFEFTPVWFASVVVAGAVAAAMSTADSQLHAVSTLITRDWYEPLAGSDVDERTVTRTARLLVPLLGAISYVIAVQEVRFILDLAAVSLYNAAQVFPILVGGLVWPRASRSGALSGFVLGVTVTCVLTFDVITLPASLPGFVPGFYGLLVNVVTFVSLGLLGPDSENEDVLRVQRYLEYATRRQWEETVRDDD